MCQCIECVGDQPEPPTDEIEAKRYQWLKDHYSTTLIIAFFGNGCINKTMADVENVIDKNLSFRVRGSTAHFGHNSGESKSWN